MSIGSYETKTKTGHEGEMEALRSVKKKKKGQGKKKRTTGVPELIILALTRNEWLGLVFFPPCPARIIQGRVPRPLFDTSKATLGQTLICKGVRAGAEGQNQRAQRRKKNRKI